MLSDENGRGLRELKPLASLSGTLPFPFPSGVGEMDRGRLLSLPMWSRVPESPPRKVAERDGETGGGGWFQVHVEDEIQKRVGVDETRPRILRPQ